MKNYWLRKYSEPIIEQVSWPDEIVGNKWYVVKCRTDGDIKKSLYLHKDGTWFNVTVRDDKYTGYFDTKEEAEAVLATSQS